MMRYIIRPALICVAMAALIGCSSRYQHYNGPEVTRVTIFKQARRLYLFHDDQLLKAYEIDLGFAPVGDKKIEGDGRTPEGAYVIDRRNPRSEFHLSLGINYPNKRDIAEAKAVGKDPGGDIFIHGQGKLFSPVADWTWGCIAVSNNEIEEIYSMVRDGTPIAIYQ